MQLEEPHAVHIRKGPPRPQDAITPIPVSASAYDMTSEDEIGDALDLLAMNGDAISMYAPGSREVVLGRILTVDPKLPHFVMELNEGATLAPGKVTFVASLRNAKLQFRLSNLEWASLPNHPELIPMVFPETCAVLNRRASERMETPLGSSFTASFMLNGNPYELPVYDFSLGGIGLQCAKNEAKGLLKGRKLQEVQLEHGEDPVILTEIEIRYTRSLRSFLLGEQLHIGCKFINTTPETEGELKRLQEQIHKASHQR